MYRILKAYDLITSPAFVVLAAAKTFAHPTHRPNELWQTDFTYLHVVGWGWYYLSTVLDDYSRYILAWTLRPTMHATDVMETLDLARASTGVDRVPVVHRPRLLSDNGPCYLSQQLATYLDTHGLPHTRSAPYHPMTQGKIERYHRSLKNVVKLEHYYAPWEVERAVAASSRLQSPAVSRSAAECDARRCVLRPAGGYPGPAGTHQTANVAATEARKLEPAASRGHSPGSVSNKRRPIVQFRLTTYTPRSLR